MTLITILAASSSPVARADLMAQLHLDATADADQLGRLDQMIADAVEHIAGETGLTLAPTDLEQRLDGWPARCVMLAAGPVRAIDALAYLDVDGVEQLVDPTDYSLALVRSAEGELWLKPGFAAPLLADEPGAVRIRFAAGFNDPDSSGSEPDDRLALDGRARQAVIMLAATWFDDRAAAEPEGVTRLINRLRVYR